MLTTATLRQELERNLRSINEQIYHIEMEAKDAGVASTKLKYVDGKYVLTDLLVAKAETLSALTAIAIKKEKK